MRKTHKSPDARLEELVRKQRARISPLDSQADQRWLLVDVAGQRLALVEGERIILVKPVSTARAGIDCRQDSGGTPDGLHRIARKIGDNEEWGTEFSSRRPTGRRWSPDELQRGEADDQGDLILTRILTLEGLDPGHNQGPGVDSLERYIYIHGTNHEKQIGAPVSHGCIRLTNDDVMELFEKMEPGDPVVIV
jgi:UDP-N-acetylmuramate--alanine ligase|nr:L,D-transpeptidase [Candidatus Krumholzibacteria bacterium]